MDRETGGKAKGVNPRLDFDRTSPSGKNKPVGEGLRYFKGVLCSAYDYKAGLMK
jgi:hypothetical protein